MLGVVLMNYSDFFYLGRHAANTKENAVTTVVMTAVRLVFAAKSWTLLSFLFGYGFAVVIQNVSNKGMNPVRFFARRMGWLLLLAVVNSALFFGDILKDYALLGLLLLCFYRAGVKTLFITSLVLLAGIPALAAFINQLPDSGMSDLAQLFPLYQSNNPFNVLWFGLAGTYVSEMISKPYLYTVHVVMLCCFLWGMCAQKIHFFGRLAENRAYVKRICCISLPAAILFFCLTGWSKHYNWKMNTWYQPGYLFVLSGMLFIASGICWLYLAGKLKRFFWALQYMGKMTLTNYMTQNLVSIFVFSGFGFGVFNKAPYLFYLLLAVSVYIIQVFFSKWWLLRNNYGPVEWLWRQLSYGKRLPLAKAAQQPAVAA